jgi:hypothetical protein
LASKFYTRRITDIFTSFVNFFSVYFFLPLFSFLFFLLTSDMKSFWRRLILWKKTSNFKCPFMSLHIVSAKLTLLKWDYDKKYKVEYVCNSTTFHVHINSYGKTVKNVFLRTLTTTFCDAYVEMWCQLLHVPRGNDNIYKKLKTIKLHMRVSGFFSSFNFLLEF